VREMAIDMELFADPRAALEEVTGALELFEPANSVEATPGAPTTTPEPAAPPAAVPPCLPEIAPQRQPMLSDDGISILTALKNRRMAEIASRPQAEPGECEQDFENALVFLTAEVRAKAVTPPWFVDSDNSRATESTRKNVIMAW
jgi:hypothetical protein